MREANIQSDYQRQTYKELSEAICRTCHYLAPVRYVLMRTDMTGLKAFGSSRRHSFGDWHNCGPDVGDRDGEIRDAKGVDGMGNGRGLYDRHAESVSVFPSNYGYESDVSSPSEFATDRQSKKIGMLSIKLLERLSCM